MVFAVTAVFSAMLSPAVPLPGVALTPPMGWSSWNAFHGGINERVIANVTDQLVATGLRDAGYVYVNLDDCWMARFRDNITGQLVAGTNFPNGMKALGDMIHKKGMKYGLYSDRGYRTCQGFPGLLDNEALDVHTMAGFGIDFLKNDGCYTTAPQSEGGFSGGSSSFVHYLRTHDALLATGRSIVHNVKGASSGGATNAVAREVSNMMRCGGDIGDSFGSAVGEFMTCYDSGVTDVGPGFWNDPDSLEIGNGRQTKQEYQAHFAMWCVGKHPLILGYDLGNPKCQDCTSPTDILEILLNKELIAINQDKLGKPATRMAENSCVDPVPAPPHPPNFRQKVTSVWAGPLVGDAHVVMLLNTESNSTGGADPALDCAAASFDVSTTLGVPHGTQLSWRDLWNPQSTGTVTAGVKNLTFSVPAHAAVVLRFENSASLASSGFDQNQETLSNGGGSVVRPIVALIPSLPSRPRSAQQFPAGVAVTQTGPAKASPPAPWPMRGHDPLRSGRSALHGPANTSAGLGIKWNFGNCTAPAQRPCNNPSVYEAIPVVSAVNGGLVLATLSFGNGNQGTYLYALDLETGAQHWNASINGTAWGSLLLAAALDGDELAVVGSKNGSVYAFVVATGQLRWRYQTGGPVITAPATSDPADPMAAIWVGSWDCTLYKLDRSTGAVLASVAFETELRTAPAVFQTSGGGDVGSGSTEHLYFSLGNSHLCVESSGSSASVLWRQNTTAFAYGAPAVSANGKTVFFPPSGDRLAWARDAESGATLWSAHVGCPDCDSTGSQSGVFSQDGTIYYVVGRMNPGNGECGFSAFDVAQGTLLHSLSINTATAALALTIDAADTIWLVDQTNVLRGYVAATATLLAAVPLAQQGTGNAPGVAIARTGLAVVAIDGVGITAVGR